MFGSCLCGAKHRHCFPQVFLLGNCDVTRRTDIFSLLIGFMIGWFLKSYLSYRKEKKEVQNILNK